MKWLLVLSLVAPSFLHAEELYKCKTEAGATVYSDLPCTQPSSGKQSKATQKVISLGQARFDSSEQPRPVRYSAGRTETPAQSGYWRCTTE